MVTKHSSTRKSAARKKPAVKPEPSLWRRLSELGDAIPDEVIAKMPRDLSQNFDHYAHGSPKQD